MKKTLILAASLLVLATLATLAAAEAFARTDSEIEEAVRATVMSRHPDDTPSWWRGLGPQAPRIIMRLFEAESVVFRRMRLLEGLSAFSDDPQAVEFIRAQAESTSEDVVRNNAIRVIGLTQGAKEEEFLAKFLQHPDPHTRLAAAQALKRAGSPTALAKVERFMAEEKAPWVVAKLKGEQPKAPASLRPTSSSEDRLSQEMAGTWQGYWVAPKADTPSGMKSELSQLKLGIASATELSGSLTVKSRDKLRSFRLSQASGRANRWAGVLVEETKGPREESPCEGELLRQNGSFLMQIRIPRTGGLIYLRRVSASRD